MKIHLVGGFLGSGKTTAIASASKILQENGSHASIITNDQGKYLVDSHYIRGIDIPTHEVTGGCFCCNYDQLDFLIDQLKTETNPKVIFAESVGSCTDLVATVLKPLLKFRGDLDQVTFSTLVDSRLLVNYLKKDPLPFDTDTNYIWEKQLEESEILIVNKTDLLSEKEFQFIRSVSKVLFPSKVWLLQNSHERSSIEKWIEALDSIPLSMKHQVLDVDYERYGKGEANLAWLDQSIEFTSEDQSALKIAHEFISDLGNGIARKSLPVGHLKFLLSYNGQSHKLSETTIRDTENQKNIISERSNRVCVMVNARVQTLPDQLRNIMVEAVNQLRLKYNIGIEERDVSFFQPGFPKPTHRFSE